MKLKTEFFNQVNFNAAANLKNAEIGGRKAIAAPIIPNNSFAGVKLTETQMLGDHNRARIARLLVPASSPETVKKAFSTQGLGDQSPVSGTAYEWLKRLFSAIGLSPEDINEIPPELLGELWRTGLEIAFNADVGSVGVVAGGGAGVEGETTDLPGDYVELTVELEVTFGANVTNRFALVFSKILDILSKKAPDSEVLKKFIAFGRFPFKFTADGEIGFRFTAEFIVSEDDAAAIESGERPLPNPFEPETIPVGGRVLIRGQSLTSLFFEAGYQFTSVGGSRTDLEGTAIGVERIDETRVRVYVGPTAAVERELFVGLRNPAVRFGLGNETEHSVAELRVAEFDLSTPEGRAAYDAFLRTGELPPVGSPGVLRTGTVVEERYSSQTMLEVGLFGASVEFGGAGNEGFVRTTHWDDGSRDVNYWYRYDDRFLEVNQRFDQTGAVIRGSSTYTIYLSDVDGNTSAIMLAGYSPGLEATDEMIARTKGSDQDIALTYTEDELMSLRDQARRLIEIDPTAQSNSLYAALAEAETPEEVALILVRHSTSSEGLCELLEYLAYATGKPLPGEMTMEPSE